MEDKVNQKNGANHISHCTDVFCVRMLKYNLPLKIQEINRNFYRIFLKRELSASEY